VYCCASDAFEINQNIFEFFARQCSKRIGASNRFKRDILMNRRVRRHPDDVLRYDIEWFFLDANRIECLLPDELRCPCRVHEVVNVCRHKNAVTGAIQRMAGATDALNGARHAFRRRHHHDEIDCPDVDSQFQAGRANHRAQLAVFQTVLHLQTDAAIERRVMDFNLFREIRQQLF
jgi:hypothetical protein